MNEDTASKVALDAIQILNRLAPLVPEQWRLQTTVDILLNRMQIIVESELSL
jgi:hypothetical protein